MRIKRLVNLGFALSVVVAIFASASINYVSAQTAAPTSATTAASTTLPTAAATYSGTPLPDVTLTLAAYSVPADAYKELIPLFQAQWLAKTGQKVIFQQSYAGSGAQSRAVIGGLEADVVALSLETDVTKIAQAKLITHDWQAGDYHGFVTDSVVVLAVRKDNPKNIKDWADLTQAGLGILTPDPSTSGGAQWNILAAYGAVRHGKVAGYDNSDAGALKYLGDIFKNVLTLDKDGQASLLTFEKGIGDVAINYENAVLGSIQSGTSEAIVYLPSTILVENPIAVVDAYVDKHGTRAVAEAFVKFLFTPDAQRIYAKHSFRPVEPTVAKDPTVAKQFPILPDLFTIAEFNGWSKVSSDLFGTKGTITAVLNNVKGQ